MIRPLRKRHGWMILAVGIVVGTLAIAGLLLRPEPAIQEDLPAGLRSSVGPKDPEGAGLDVAAAGLSAVATP